MYDASDSSSKVRVSFPSRATVNAAGATIHQYLIERLTIADWATTSSETGVVLLFVSCTR